MTNPSEYISEPQPEPDPEAVEALQRDFPFIIKAIYEVANKLGGAEFASSVTSWGIDMTGRPHQVALDMLRAKRKDAEDLINAKIEELRAAAEAHTSRVKKFGDAVVERTRNLFD